MLQASAITRSTEADAGASRLTLVVDMVAVHGGWRGRVAEHSATVVMSSLSDEEERVACPRLSRESDELERTVRDDNHFGPVLLVGPETAPGFDWPKIHGSFVKPEFPTVETPSKSRAAHVDIAAPKVTSRRLRESLEVLVIRK